MPTDKIEKVLVIEKWASQALLRKSAIVCRLWEVITQTAQ